MRKLHKEVVGGKTSIVHMFLFYEEVAAIFTDTEFGVAVQTDSVIWSINIPDLDMYITGDTALDLLMNASVKFSKLRVVAGMEYPLSRKVEKLVHMPTPDELLRSTHYPYDYLYGIPNMYYWDVDIPEGIELSITSAEKEHVIQILEVNTTLELKWRTSPRNPIDECEFKTFTKITDIITRIHKNVHTRR